MSKRSFSKKLDLKKETLRVLAGQDSAEINAGVIRPHITQGDVASCYNTAFHLSCNGLSDCIC